MISNIIKISFLLLTLLFSQVDLFAQLETQTDSEYVKRMSSVSRTKLMEVALQAHNPFLCFNIHAKNHQGKVLVPLTEYKKWYVLEKSTGTFSMDEFINFSLPYIVDGDTLYVNEENSWIQVDVDTSSYQYDRTYYLNTCLQKCNNEQVDYNEVATLFYWNILIENKDGMVDDGPQYWPMPFDFYNHSSSPEEQTFFLLNSSLQLFLDSIQPSGDVVIFSDYVWLFGNDLKIHGDERYNLVQYNRSNTKKLSNNVSIITLDEFYVFNGEVIISYQLCSTACKIVKGKKQRYATSSKTIRYTYKYNESEQEWQLQ